MKKYVLIFIGVFMGYSLAASGYQPGEKAASFRLKNVDGTLVGFNDFPEAKGFIVIFTCNTCPYAQAYEERIIALDEKYKDLGFPVIAVNSNDPDVSPGDSYPQMKKRAAEKQFTFPYLFDEKQEVLKAYGAARTPQVYILKKDRTDLVVSYVGAIDNNYRDPAAVTQFYVEKAVDALLQGTDPEVAFTKAIGCTIKVKQ